MFLYSVNIDYHLIFFLIIYLPVRLSQAASRTYSEIRLIDPRVEFRTTVLAVWGTFCPPGIENSVQDHAFAIQVKSE